MTRPSMHAVFPGTFDPFTPGHVDLVDRARRLFDRLTVLVAVSGQKQPGSTVAERARAIRAQLPPSWLTVTVSEWSGLTVTYCLRHGCGVIVRGVRNTADARYEHQLAAMNEALGVTTLLLPARPELATMSSTLLRAHQP